MARLVFLGRLEDVAGADEITLPLAAPTPLDAVVAQLPAALARALGDPRIRVAVNGALVAGPALIAPGDELAFLPPVSGG